jgi:hypothetical protein
MGPFLTSAHWELNVARVEHQRHVYRSVSLGFDKAVGWQVLPGEDTPSLD